MNDRRQAGFSDYNANLEQSVFQFQEAEYPERRASQIPAYWRWMFVESAKRLGVNPSTWFYVKDGDVVAHQGAMPVSVLLGGNLVSSGWFVETMVAARLRGTPIGPMLIKKALEDMPFNLSLGQTDQMRDIQLALGWKHVAGMPRYVLVCGYRMNLRNKLPPVVAEIAAALLGVRYRLRHWRLGRRTGPKYQFVRPDRFSSEHDELWSRMAASCTCAVVRDSSYLNWKYLDRPFRKFQYLDMREEGVLVGTAILSLASPNDVYPHIRGHIIDFVVDLKRQDHLSALVNASVGMLMKQGAQTVTCQALANGVGETLGELGFVSRSSRHQFLVAVDSAEERHSRLVLDPQNWFLTPGDSDADSYAD